MGTLSNAFLPSKPLPSPPGPGRARQRTELIAPREEDMGESWEQTGIRASLYLSCLSVGHCSLVCTRMKGGSAPVWVLGAWSATQAGSPCMSYRFSPAGSALCISPSPLLFLRGCSGLFLVQPCTAGFGLGSTASPAQGGGGAWTGGLRDEGCSPDRVSPGAEWAGAPGFPWP